MAGCSDCSMAGRCDMMCPLTCFIRASAAGAAEAAETAGLAGSANRSRTAADESNGRAVIDRGILAYFAGASATLRTWSQRAAVLAALQPSHRLRVLSLVSMLMLSRLLLSAAGICCC